jgi:4-hydroxy-3-methylbut-2-enyl diphosphate reductase IspH
MYNYTQCWFRYIFRLFYGNVILSLGSSSVKIINSNLLQMILRRTKRRSTQLDVWNNHCDMFGTAVVNQTCLSTNKISFIYRLANSWNTNAQFNSTQTLLPHTWNKQSKVYSWSTHLSLTTQHNTTQNTLMFLDINITEMLSRI